MVPADPGGLQSRVDAKAGCMASEVVQCCKTKGPHLFRTHTWPLVHDDELHSFGAGGCSQGAIVVKVVRIHRHSMPWIERRWEAIRVASTSWQIGELQLFKEGVVIQAQHKQHDHCKTLRWVRAMDVMNL